MLFLSFYKVEIYSCLENRGFFYIFSPLPHLLILIEFLLIENKNHIFLGGKGNFHFLKPLISLFVILYKICIFQDKFFAKNIEFTTYIYNSIKINHLILHWTIIFEKKKKKYNNIRLCFQNAIIYVLLF